MHHSRRLRQRVPQLVMIRNDQFQTQLGRRLSFPHTADPAVVPHLIPVLDDDDTFVRMAVARVLGDLGGDEAVSPLIDTLSDPAESVRDAAVASLRQITNQNFRFDPLGKESDRTKRIRAWRDWWEKENKV